MFIGAVDSTVVERFEAQGYATVVPERRPNDAGEIGDLIAWMCTNVDAVYMGPGWRNDTLARALHAVAIAAEIKLLGFE